MRAKEIKSLRVDLRRRPGSPIRIHCCVSLECADGERNRLEEDAENVGRSSLPDGFAKRRDSAPIGVIQIDEDLVIG